MQELNHDKMIWGIRGLREKWKGKGMVRRAGEGGGGMFPFI